MTTQVSHVHVKTVHAKRPATYTTTSPQAVVSRYQRSQELAPLFAIPVADLGTVVITEDQFDALISAWNRMSGEWRKARYQLCRRDGHERVGIDGTTSRICRRCCETVRGRD